MVRTNGGSPYVYPHTYGFNFGTWFVYDPNTGEGGDGVFFPNSRLAPVHISDGLSNTLCAAEVKAFTPYVRNTADPGPSPPSSPAVVAAWAAGGQRKLGPNTNDCTGHTEWPDGRVHHSGFTTAFTPNTVVPFVWQGATYDIDYNSRQEGNSAAQRTYAAITARSRHTSGMVNVLLMDGSVRSVKNSIDLATWRALGTRAGGEVVGDY
jgi:prepilin-type processing-associated H-X9-DG protein